MPRQGSTVVRDLPRGGLEAGVVVAVSAWGTLTLRGREVSEGTVLRDQRGRFTGRVVRVFGPVANPYLSVRSHRRLTPEDLLVMVGETLIVK